jgi:phage regulator Rha-like protein
MKNIVVMNNHELVVSIEDIAKFSGVEILSIQKLIKEHNDRFNIELSSGSYKQLKYLCLTEKEAYHLITYMKNTDQVKNFKDNLIEQFFIYRDQLCEANEKQFKKLENKLARKDERIRELSETVYAKPRGNGFETVFRIIKDCKADISTSDFNRLLAIEGVLLEEEYIARRYMPNGTQSLESGNSIVVHVDTALDVLNKCNIDKVEDRQQRFEF